MVVEDPETRAGEKDIEKVGGTAGLQAMGLAPWDEATTKESNNSNKESERKVEGSNGADTDETKSTSSSTSTSRAEADLVALSNLILFPDRSMMGF